MGRPNSHADFGWACHAARTAADFAELQGCAFGGSFSEAAAWMQCQTPSAQAFVAFFPRKTGTEKFLAGLPPAVAAIPMVGGSPARDSDAGLTMPFASDAAVFAIHEGRWRSVPVRAHVPRGPRLNCLGDGPRHFHRISMEGAEYDAHRYLGIVRVQQGLDESDWDRLALLAEDGSLIHLHDAGEAVGCGADLPASREVRLAIFDENFGKQAVLSHLTPGSLIFGCAGLHGLFPANRPWEQRAPTTYLHGEVAHFDGQPRFTNLTFAILQRIG